MAFDARRLDLALATAGAPSLADVMVFVRNDASLTSTRRRDLASAVRRTAAALELPVDQVPADPAWLRPRLSALAPARLGIQQKSLTNLFSDLKAALAVSDVPISRGRPRRLSADWRALQEALAEKRHRIGLSRFIQFCDNLSIRPEAVSDETLEHFRTALLETELRKRPEDLIRDTAVFWNQARDRVPGWPQVVLAVPNRTNFYVKPPEDFPESLACDVDAWLARLAVNDPFDPDGPPKTLRPVTIEGHRARLWRFASAVVLNDIDPRTITGLDVLVRPEIARAGLKFLLKRNGDQTSGSIYNSFSLLKSIARWWVKTDDEDLEVLSRLGSKLAIRSEGLTARNRERLRPFEEKRAIRELARLPEDLRAAAGKVGSPVAAARLQEVALAVDILLHCPMRIENLRRLDRRLHFRGVSGRGMRIVIPASEVKNNRELDFPISPALAKSVETFLRTHHSQLNPEAGGLLFPARTGVRPASGAVLGRRISASIRERTGFEINPHLFRHLAAKIYLQANPGDYETVRRLLGHSLTSSTIDAYAGFETASATARYAEIVDDLVDGKRSERRGRR